VRSLCRGDDDRVKPLADYARTAPGLVQVLGAPGFMESHERGRGLRVRGSRG